MPFTNTINLVVNSNFNKVFDSLSFIKYSVIDLHPSASCTSNLNSCKWPTADIYNNNINGGHAFEIHSIPGVKIEFNITLLESSGNTWDLRRCNIQFYIDGQFIKGFYNIAFAGSDAVQGNGNHFDVRLFDCDGYTDGYYIANKHPDKGTDHIYFTMSESDDGYARIVLTSH